MSTLVALIQAKPTKKKQKTKQHQKEVRNDDQLKPNLTTFSGLFVWSVTEKAWSVTLVALVVSVSEPKKNSTSK